MGGVSANGDGYLLNGHPEVAGLTKDKPTAVIPVGSAYVVLRFRGEDLFPDVEIVGGA